MAMHPQSILTGPHHRFRTTFDRLSRATHAEQKCVQIWKPDIARALHAHRRIWSIMSLTHNRGTLPAVLTILPILLLFVGLAACSGPEHSSPPIVDTGTPGAEEAVGERLFLETRFAQSFKVFLDRSGNINDPRVGDSVTNTLETLTSPIDPGPFKGMSMNCRACHLVDDVLLSGGMRTYADLARRSPIPARADGKTHARETLLHW